MTNEPGCSHHPEDISDARRVEVLHVLVASPKDNVGVVVVERIDPGTEVFGACMKTGATFTLEVNDPISFGHKVALVSLEPGVRVIKHGQGIGKIVKRVPKGGLVHTLNLVTEGR
jgi:hypothetical protein